MVVFFFLVSSAALALAAWGVISLRVVAIGGSLTPSEKRVGGFFLAATYVLALGLTQAVQVF